MIDKRKILGGGGSTSELEDAPLNDDTLEAVTGGHKKTLETWADESWDDVVKRLCGDGENKEEQP